METAREADITSQWASLLEVQAPDLEKLEAAIQTFKLSEAALHI